MQLKLESSISWQKENNQRFEPTLMVGFYLGHKGVQHERHN